MEKEEDVRVFEGQGFPRASLPNPACSHMWHPAASLPNMEQGKKASSY